jgi:hypothetical protein
MTLQELLEHAHLDALGQLDEREQAAFEAAFTVAPPAVKAQVRHEQARWAPMEHLLPQVEPSPELRERVLDAVTAAMVAQDAGELSLRPGRRVAAAWRTASIGLITAVVVLGAALVYISDSERQNAKLQKIGQVTDTFGEMFRAEFRDALMDSKTAVHYLTVEDQAAKCKGSMWSNPSWDSSVVFLELPKNKAGEDYRIVAIENGKAKELARFEPTGPFHAAHIPVLEQGTKIAIVTATKGQLATLDHVLLTVTV